jgi:hypothetical protein
VLSDSPPPEALAGGHLLKTPFFAPPAPALEGDSWTLVLSITALALTLLSTNPLPCSLDKDGVSSFEEAVEVFANAGLGLAEGGIGEGAGLGEGWIDRASGGLLETEDESGVLPTSGAVLRLIGVDLGEGVPNSSYVVPPNLVGVEVRLVRLARFCPCPPDERRSVSSFDHDFLAWVLTAWDEARSSVVGDGERL